MTTKICFSIPMPGKYTLLDDFKLEMQSDWRASPEILMFYGFEASHKITDLFNADCELIKHPDWIMIPFGTVIQIHGYDIKERKHRGMWHKAKIGFPVKLNPSLSKPVDPFGVLSTHIPNLVRPTYSWNIKRLADRRFRFTCNANNMNGMELEPYDQSN